MTCNNCITKAKSQLLKMGEVTAAEVQLTSPQATITMRKHIPLAELQSELNHAGNYIITDSNGGMNNGDITNETSWINTYKPILIIGAYITGVTLFIELRGVFSWESWMRNFMSGFFLVFSFFKLLDIKGFAQNYSSYDIIAKNWQGWGYVYAFIELVLGVAFLVNFNPFITNAVTFVIMSISIIGVLQSVINKRKIQCACLGSVFNLPMSTITIIEDALMIIMSGWMLLQFI